jgi:hypothetical protein
MEGKGKAKLMIRVRGYKSEIKGWRTRVVGPIILDAAGERGVGHLRLPTSSLCS